MNFLQKKANEYTLWEKMTRFDDWILQVAIDKETKERSGGSKNNLENNNKKYGTRQNKTSNGLKRQAY